MDEKIAAIIVTFNRVTLLEKCIQAVINQTKIPDKIFIIDNASTDNTEAFIKNINNSLITYHKLPENIGGAGGFYTGCKLAFAQNYDWLWLMDDDGQADQHCLATLWQYKQNYHFICPLVLSIEDHDQFSFAYHNKNKLIYSIYDLPEQMYLTEVKPFNGTLLSKQLIQTIGFPLKEMFIWGDEVEYILRTQKYHFQTVTITQAKYYHPLMKQVFQNTILGKVISANTLKTYCFYRNHFYIKQKYSKIVLLWAMLSLLKYISILDYKNLIIVLKAFYHAITQQWGKEKQFL